MRKSIYRVINIILLISVFSGLYYCSDSTSPDNTSGGYLPMSVGNYWIYNTYKLDEYGSIIYDSLKVDSLAVVELTEFNGKSAYKMIKYRNGIGVDTIYYYKEGKLIYCNENEKSTWIPSMKDKWCKIADFTNWTNLDWWHVHDTLILNFPIEFDTASIIARSHHTINAAPEGSDSISINSSKYFGIRFYFKNDNLVFFTYKFWYSYIADSTVNDTTYHVTRIACDTVQVNKARLMYRRYWYSDNIGIIQMKIEPYVEKWYTTPWTAQFTDREVRYPGSISILTRYKLK